MFIKGFIALILVSVVSSVYSQSLDVNVTIKLPQEHQSVRLYNFESSQYDSVTSPSTLTREQCLKYLPDMNGQAVRLLDVFIAKGKSPYRALTLVHFKIRHAISQQNS
ncbi:hypothetical protein [Kangiella shandongensis]|uniref:hypothetical protein n=1 Tax=Kangiella shandongensis TaxID=2763258 RepID=UPI001CBBE29D|nr:hypothetical protein [Kangiella shandongensis]